MVYKCIIVDDEPPAVKVLSNFIKQVPQLELSATCKNAFEVLNILHEKRVDLLFLDIHMPKLFGTELLRSLIHPPKVIFTTAHKEYAHEAFELDAVDYLLKPISFERFLKAINKIITVNNSPGFEVPVPVSFLYFRAERKMIKILLKEIRYIESYRDYIIIHLKESREFKIKLPLNHVEKMLPPNRFLRIHRSFIVAIDKITAFTKSDVEIGTIELPIGKSFTTAFGKLTSNTTDFPDGIPER
ncbi:LytR/AlgR family response regulator transcription factor [Salinimicrobium oceani]|uniref:Response regulator transcription factor n=1 Tax=Salinimicrobium oceani TaxID=2722702 RepID=A0ABX1D0W4_9FLAO|nr:response regulator transcription factor [Salinimicrobium oceani]NJW52313.1 response regulator transcription factor [Salinimicrobium oceani]